MNDIVQFIEDLGGLHDARIVDLFWYSSDRRLELQIDDIHANSQGLPEAANPEGGTFIFFEVATFLIDADLGIHDIAIYEWVANMEGKRVRSTILCSPGGRLEIECERIECRLSKEQSRQQTT